MHTGKSYKLPEFIAWTRRSIYILLVLSFVPVALYQLAGWKWLAIPWGVVFLLGATVALSAGFKNVQTYNRLQEAQQVWSSIASSSRIWGTMCRDLAADPEQARMLVYRHLAWLTALRHEMRRVMAWETSDKVYNAEYRRNYSVPEREQLLEGDLLKYLSPNETSQVLSSRNRSLQVMALQSRATKSLLGDGGLGMSAFNDLQKVIRNLQALHGRSEQIKNFPLPRQYVFINSLFVWILCVLLPFGMISEFAQLGATLDASNGIDLVWLCVPLSLLISWMYMSLNQVVESTENPFEGGANDVPISRICEEIEIDLREMLGESNVPAPSRQASDIAV